MKFKLLFLIGIMICVLTGCKNNILKSEQGVKNTNDNNGQVVQKENSSDYYDSDDMEYKYEIEKVFQDNTFSSIIKGEIVPVEIKYGFGGVGGYKQYSTKDSKIINDYIETFKEVKIKEMITDKDDMIVIIDAIEDYVFIMEDGTEVVVGTYLSKYVCNSDVEYVLENNEKLVKLNELLRGH